jgi:hypothetical protein
MARKRLIKATIDLLQHRISPEFLLNRGVRDAENVIDDVNEAVGGGDVGLNDGRIHTSALDRNRFVVAITAHDVEVEELLVDVCRDLNNLCVEGA